MKVTKIPADTPVLNGANLTDGSVSYVKLADQITRTVLTSSDTPASSDNGKLIVIDSASGAISINIETSLSLSSGQRIDFVWRGPAISSVTFVQGSGVILNATPGLKLRSVYSAASLVCVESNNYVLVGDLSA